MTQGVTWVLAARRRQLSSTRGPRKRGARALIEENLAHACLPALNECNPRRPERNAASPMEARKPKQRTRLVFVGRTRAARRRSPDATRNR
jgi:hypothetical protein